jgi:hypothetical protein
MPQSGQECQRITTYHASQLRLGADEHRDVQAELFVDHPLDALGDPVRQHATRQHHIAALQIGRDVAKSFLLERRAEPNHGDPIGSDHVDPAQQNDVPWQRVKNFSGSLDKPDAPVWRAA